MVNSGNFKTALMPYAGQFPFVVSVQYNRSVMKNEIVHCTGAVLNSKSVLTSCICLKEMDISLPLPDRSNLRIVGGTTDRMTKTEGQVRFVEDMIIHPKCAKPFSFDFSAMTVTFPFDMKSSYVRKLPLPAVEENTLTMILDELYSLKPLCYVLGWGTLQNLSYMTDDFRERWCQGNLHMIEVNVYKAETCGGNRTGSETGDVPNVEKLGFVCGKPTGDTIPNLGFRGGPVVCGYTIVGFATRVSETECVKKKSDDLYVWITRLDFGFQFIQEVRSKALPKKRIRFAFTICLVFMYIILIEN